MDRSGRRLRHSQALLLTTQRPEVGGGRGGVHFHSLTVMVTAPEKWGGKGGRESSFKQFHSASLAVNTQL